MSVQSNPAQNVDIDISGLLSHVWRKRFLVLAITVATGIALFLYFSTVAPKYESSARILIENRESVFTRTDEDRQAAEQYDKEAIGSQVEVVRSDTIALAVIKKLGLARLSEFNGGAGASLLSDVLSAAGVGEGKPKISPEAKVLDRFKEKLTVYSITDSRVIVVKFSSTDPRLARDVPNAVADEFLSMQKDASLDTTQNATEWLGPEIAKMRDRVRLAEAKVAEYRASSDLLVGNNNSLLATQQLSEISSELTRLKAERSSAEARVASVRRALGNGSSMDTIPEVASSQMVQRLRERKLAISGQLSDLATTLLPNHPRIKSLNAQLIDLDRQIVVAAQNILTGLEDNVSFSREKESELLGEVNRLKSESSRVSEAAVELRALEREATAERELLQTYLKRFREAASRQSGEYVPVNARIISRANLPLEHYFPKTGPFAAAGAVAALVLTVISILAWALLTGRAFAVQATGSAPLRQEDAAFQQDSVDAVASGIGIDTVELDGTLSEPVHSGAALASPANSNSLQNDANNPYSGTYAQTVVSDAIAGLDGARVVVITPAGISGGSISVILARKLAAVRDSVVLFDLAPSRSSAGEMLGTAAIPGAGDVLSGMKSMQEVVFQDNGSNAHVIAQGRNLTEVPGNVQDLLAMFTDNVADSYSHVIIDCGATSADGIYSVARADSVLVIDPTGADLRDCAALERDLLARGYEEVIQLNPRFETNRVQAQSAA